MDQTLTFNHLTPEQREQWDRDGFLVINNALSMREVEELTAEVDRLNEESQRQGRDPHSFFDVMDIIETARERTGNGRSLQTKPNEVFLNLIDHPNHLGIVCDLMGAAIQLTASQMMIRPPIPTPSREWHQDSAPPYGFPKVHDRVPLQQFRIGLFLTDMDKPDMGNFCVIPGSHRNGFPQLPAGLDHALAITSFDRFKEFEQIDAGVPGARQITLKAGDGIAFHNALFHCVVRNTSNDRRKNLYYIYTPWWHRLRDRVQSSPELIAKCDPVRKQLLGALSVPNIGVPAPLDGGAPLVRLFEERGYREVQNGIVEDYIRQTQR